jgi:hypothetical protein
VGLQISGVEHQVVRIREEHLRTNEKDVCTASRARRQYCSAAEEAWDGVRTDGEHVREAKECSLCSRVY